MREEEEDINHQFDVWHVCKNIKKKLFSASKKKSSEHLNQWIKSICNHFWWSCATSQGDAKILREKWTSIIFHVQNIHRFNENKSFKKCEHPRITKRQCRSKLWLKPTSDAFLALQSVVFDKTLLKDLEHLTEFSHTGILEVYHSLYNKWLPKSTHFSYHGMLARSQLAALDFNSGSNLEQATTATGKQRYNLNFSKITKSWSVKPIKEKKDYIFLHNLMHQTVEIVSTGITVPPPNIPDLPKNIAPIEAPPNEDANQRSRLSI
jgi:hypothetical protein